MSGFYTLDISINANVERGYVDYVVVVVLEIDFDGIVARGHAGYIEVTAIAVALPFAPFHLYAIGILNIESKIIGQIAVCIDVHICSLTNGEVQ